ncbi:hypothetical protein [Dictyobacter kobayashii]|uniref:Uncharacterized protein n=1 Tax=Dictyobacter kobayashii TaxID=2014872 RepID=A0A402AW39_9CHLR|nr:hypothetical protein [Dictyobacter kobayashii]GCE23275.1 hypothetical protein KDK_70750 [Dictyobacter kobayashii]
MPEYAQVQTYVRCDKNTFPEVVHQFRQVLEHVHCISPGILDWLSHLNWPSWEQGYANNAPTIMLQSQAGVFLARPYVYFPQSDEEEKWAGWVELAILFEAESLQEVTIPAEPYKVHAGQFIWNILKAFSLAFLENGIYFTDELQDGLGAEMVMENKESFWCSADPNSIYPLFDAALLSVELVSRFQPIPEIFEQVYLPGAIGVAVKGRFLTLPWNVSPSV